jgi:hypothetical protein
MHYGVCVADLNNDGKMEFFVCGFADQNQLLKWTGTELVNIANGTPLEDPSSSSIGVAAGDFDGDGSEELYVLNTDTFLGRKKVTDRLFDHQEGRCEFICMQSTLNSLHLHHLETAFIVPFSVIAL